MYRKKLLIISLAFMMQGAGLLTACGNKDNTSSSTITQLQAPSELNVSDYILSWTNIDAASKYLLDINNIESEVTTNSFSLFTLTLNETYDFKVKALGEGTKIDSDWSDTFSYTIITSKLPTPVLTLNGNMLTWSTNPYTRSFMFNVSVPRTGESLEWEIPFETHLGYEIFDDWGTSGNVLKIKALSNHPFYTNSEYGVLIVP